MFHSKKKRQAQDQVRADIGDLAGMAEDMPEEPLEQVPGELDMESGEPDGYEGIPESIPQEDRELMRESRQARESARERNHRDDQTRQTVFACACVVAGFCGVAGIVFGTAAVCRTLATGPGRADATDRATAPYVQGVDPADMNVYYDQAGRMHVNVYVSRQPDMDVNIRIDGEGNVTSETVQREGEATPAPTAEPEGQEGGSDAEEPEATKEPEDSGAPEDGSGATEGQDKPDGDANKPEEPDGQGGGGTKPGIGASGGGSGSAGSGATKSEEELLKELEERKKNGGSGYLDSDGAYVVQSGDTLSRISGITGFSVDFLAAYNQLENKDFILTGESIRYPAK